MKAERDGFNDFEHAAEYDDLAQHGSHHVCLADVFIAVTQRFDVFCISAAQVVLLKVTAALMRLCEFLKSCCHVFHGLGDIMKIEKSRQHQEGSGTSQQPEPHSVIVDHLYILGGGFGHGLNPAEGISRHTYKQQ